MMKKYILVFALSLTVTGLKAQCDTTTITSDYTQSSDIIMSGVYYVEGDFILPPGITIYVTEHSYDGCGTLEIHAENIMIQGTINGNYAGYEGGDGGSGGSVISSLTGHINALNDCQNKDDAGRVEVQGGGAGFAGSGTGGGVPGGVGAQGSGPKQQCLTGDEAGMIGGSGGAGGGSGGSYGGAGSAGGSGGSGTDDYTISGFTISSAYAVVGGNGGNGGSAPTVYGTAEGFDIDMGSGGAGSGGGGRSFDGGLNGGTGGKGGGLVKLVGSSSVTISGTVSVNGEDGAAGGNAGSGGVTPKCCSDGCDDCGEATVSGGAGGGAGGGSGGGIFVESGGSISVTGTLSATGGNGGSGGSKGYGSGCTYDAGTFCGDDQSIVSDEGQDGAQGGAGGGGRIKIFYVSCAGAAISPAVVSVAPGTGNGTAGQGTYETVCGYVATEEIVLSAEDVIVFPVPAVDYIQYRIPAVSAVEYVQVVNMVGQLVFEQTDAPASDMLDISILEPGVYMLVFTTGNNRISKTFIKD